jgi:hypothetical protein
MTVPVFKIPPMVRTQHENFRTRQKNQTGQLQHMQHDNMHDKLIINKHRNTCWYIAEWWWWCSWLKMIGVIKWQGACARGQSKRFTEEQCILWLLFLLHVFIHLLARWYIPSGSCIHFRHLSMKWFTSRYWSPNLTQPHLEAFLPSTGSQMRHLHKCQNLIPWAMKANQGPLQCTQQHENWELHWH